MIFRQKGISTIHLRLPQKSFHPEKFSVPEVGVIFSGSSRTSTISGQRLIASIPLILNHGWAVRATKKMTHIRSRPDLRRTGRFYVLPKSSFQAKNPFFFLSKIGLKDRYLFGKRVLFFAQLCPVVAKHGFDLEVNVFFGPKNTVFDPKLLFLL